MRTPFFRGMKRWSPLAGVALLSPVLLAACGGNPPSILDTKGPIANQEAFVFWAILWMAVGVFVLVEGALLYSIWKFRERPGMGAPRQI